MEIREEESMACLYFQVFLDTCCNPLDATLLYTFYGISKSHDRQPTAKRLSHF